MHGKKKAVEEARQITSMIVIKKSRMQACKFQAASKKESRKTGKQIATMPATNNSRNEGRKTRTQALSKQESRKTVSR